MSAPEGMGIKRGVDGKVHRPVDRPTAAVKYASCSGPGHACDPWVPVDTEKVSYLALADVPGPERCRRCWR